MSEAVALGGTREVILTALLNEFDYCGGEWNPGAFATAIEEALIAAGRLAPELPRGDQGRPA